MNKDRRDFIKQLLVGGAVGAGVLSSLPAVAKEGENKAKRPQDNTEYKYTYSSCLGCNVRCGIRVRIKNVGGNEIVDRIVGNPYHPYNRAAEVNKQGHKYDPIPYNTPVKEANEKWVGSLCPRGQDGIHYTYYPYRVLKPLKRAGKRGEGKWETISWEQLINEISFGGTISATGEKLPGLADSFALGKLKKAGVDNPQKLLEDMKIDTEAIIKLAEDKKSSALDVSNAISSFKSKYEAVLSAKGLKLSDILIDPDRPDLGTISNQVIYYRGRGQGHTDYFSTNFANSFGTVNWLRHTSACQNGYYTANKAVFGQTDLQVDIYSAKTIIMAGAQMGRLHPGATGQGLIIQRAVNNEVKIYYVNPTAPRTEANANIIWVPIKPGTDAALALALIRWVFENKKYNEEYLKVPNKLALKALNYATPSNATWLVITSGSKKGQFLRAKDLGVSNEDKVLVRYQNEFKPFDAINEGELFYSGKVNLADGSEVEVKTSLQILKEEAMSKTIKEWGEICGIDEKTIVQMAKDFAAAAPQAGTYVHRGVAMHSTGEYNVMSYRMLDILIGNYHKKGGLLGRADHTDYSHYIYEVAKFKGQPPKWGPQIDRTKFKYEKTLEYLMKVKEGKNPYGTTRPWYPLSAEESYTESFAGMFYKYPYQVKAMILHFANPVLAANYGVKFIETLSDPDKLPLFVGITTTINETYMYADYIVPDTTYLETGTSGIQYLYATSGGSTIAEAWRVPVIEPKTLKIGTSPLGHPRHASFYEFFIDLGKSLGLAGFGKGVVDGQKENAGKKYDIESVYDFIMKVYANGAMDAVKKGIIPKDVPQEDIDFVEKNYYIAKFKDVISPDEWKYVCYALARGGVFTSYHTSFDEKGMSKRKVPGRDFHTIWNEDIAKTTNTVTGVKYWGTARYYEPSASAFVNGVKEEKAFGTPFKKLYGDYPFVLTFASGPLSTKHRAVMYYYIRQINPDNFAILNPEDAKKLGVETGDIISVETPTGEIEAPVLVEPSVIKGSVVVPYGFGRWSDTVISKPKYIAGFKNKKIKQLLDGLPEKVSIDESAINPIRNMDQDWKELLFTNKPKAFYDSGLGVEKWAFGGITPNPVEMLDPSLNDWSLLSCLGATQAYYYTPAKVKSTGKKYKFEAEQLIW
ncbi:molybdopterin-dependent oxidoreductase [Calditerrivibrio sp.]|uniref:molybdopterin-dependent oxidoreductase n=1 Tax=Calditerrivibrio sp. TaxID=2792612 RepID=UPI003D0F498F